MQIFIKLSDTHPSPATHTAPGFRFPGEYKWNVEHQAHILDGRIFDTEHEPDRVAFNTACENHLRVQHKWHFPVVVVVKKVMESGFDEPEVVTREVPLSVYTQETAPALPADPAEPNLGPDNTPGPPTTPGARKKARQLGVDMETLRGFGTGAGGIVTVEDVIGQWHRDGGNPAAPPIIAGPVRMADLLAASAETP